MSVLLEFTTPVPYSYLYVHCKKILAYVYNHQNIENKTNLLEGNKNLSSGSREKTESLGTFPFKSVIIRTVTTYVRIRTEM